MSQSNESALVDFEHDSFDAKVFTENKGRTFKKIDVTYEFSDTMEN